MEPPRQGDLFRTAATLYLVLAVCGVVWIGWREQGVPWRLFVDPAWWWLDLLLGAATALLILGVWQVVRRLVPLASELEGRLRDLLGAVRREEAIGLALLSGVAEEVFFRGAVQPSWGYPLATVLFAVLHTGRGRAMWLWTAAALFAGALLGGLMLWRGTLLAPIVAHFLVNAIQLDRLLTAAPATDEETASPDGD
ncbi:MAG TPA: CPBP family intramembrane glutamic endopeptidase [Thermoanaerobaculia bacterium]|nr:CPBP family intramembrane glutamic endopeptidase [Thermoanaerobaculia bacterium]